MALYGFYHGKILSSVIKIRWEVLLEKCEFRLSQLIFDESHESFSFPPIPEYVYIQLFGSNIVSRN